MTKMLEVEDVTHKKVKSQALYRDMTIKEYVEFLVNRDIKTNKEKR